MLYFYEALSTLNHFIERLLTKIRLAQIKHSIIAQFVDNLNVSQCDIIWNNSF